MPRSPVLTGVRRPPTSIDGRGAVEGGENCDGVTNFVLHSTKATVTLSVSFAWGPRPPWEAAVLPAMPKMLQRDGNRQ